MKKQKTQSKIIVALTAVVILLVALSATLTFAYFTASNSQTSSQMTFGTLNLGGSGLVLSSTEEHVDNTQNGIITEIVPGCTINLAGSISVITNINTLVRTKMVVTVQQFRDNAGVEFDYASDAAAIADGCKATANDPTVAEQIGGKYYKEFTTSAAAVANGNKAQIIFNLINGVVTTATANGAWVDQSGWRYYNKVVNGAAVNNNTVSILDFADNSSITLAANEFGNDWQGAIVSVTFKTEAIQADHLVGPDGNDDGNDPDPIAVTIEGGVITNIAEIASALAWGAGANGIVA